MSRKLQATEHARAAVELVVPRMRPGAGGAGGAAAARGARDVMPVAARYFRTHVFLSTCCWAKRNSTHRRVDIIGN